VRALPNLLSLFRIALIPVVVWLLLEPGRGRALGAAAAFWVASLSDFADGYIARRYDITTKLGKFLDPLADKLIVMAALTMLAAMHREPAVPGWLVVVIVGRELAVTGLRAIASGEGLVLAAEELGKYKTTYQMFAITGLLMHYDFAGVDWHAGGMYFLCIATVLSLWSGFEYHVRVFRAVRLTG
jgi:CDP-diacylglycerol--glycerol-3-phosphate 3-phosphatidyltransferase